MGSMNRKAAGWLTVLFLGGAAAFSFAAMFRGDLKALIGSVICLILGVLTLKQYLSSQSLS